MVLVAWQGGASQQPCHFLLSNQPGVGPQDPQQAAYTQALHTLPPEAKMAPNGGEGGARCHAPLSLSPHG